MRYLRLDEADKIYSVTKNFKITIHKIEHTFLHRFCAEIIRFSKLVSPTDDQSIRKYSRWLARCKFKICSSPLLFDHPCMVSSESIESMNQLVRMIKLTYPDFAEKAEEILRLAKKVICDCDNPYLREITDIVLNHRCKQVGLLIKDYSLVGPIEEFFNGISAFKEVKVLGLSQLQEECFDILIILGPEYWYPDFIFNSPRARSIHLIKYSWIKGVCKKGSDFLDSSLPPNGLTGLVDPPVELISGDLNVEDEKEYGGFIDPSDLLPHINWDDIGEIGRQSVSGETEQEQVEACLFLLTGNGAVFLDNSEGSNVLVIDFEDEESDAESEMMDEETGAVSAEGTGSDSKAGLQFPRPSLKRLPIREIQIGHYILVRTEGGGDLIRPIADDILAEQAEVCREAQKLWKGLLREKVQILGADKAVSFLLNKGSQRANPNNLRNWMSSKNIKPEHYDDFQAILCLIGLEEQAAPLWNFAKAIESAHQKAGQHIRKLLLKKVYTSNLKELEKRKKMVFHLEEGGGTLTAFFVEQIAPRTFTVPISKLGNYFEWEV